MIYENIPSQKQILIDRILFVQTCNYGEEYVSPWEERTSPQAEYASPQVVPDTGFWELYYVEEGLVDIIHSTCTHTLSKTELYFRRPSEKVRISIQAPVPAKLISIGFACALPSSPGMDFFRNRVLSAGAPERRLLQHIAEEAASFQGTAPFAAGQSALLYLQLLLILLIRNADADTTPAPALRSQHRKEGLDLFLDILDYMEEHISDHLTIEQICRDQLIGRSLLQKLFAEHTGCGIIDYFTLMKINAAKQLIRKGNSNFSQIAEHLGYNSIHYFSRQFKVITGITPSEYADSLLNRRPL